MEKLIDVVTYAILALLLIGALALLTITGGVYVTGVVFNAGLLALLLINLVVWDRRKS